MPTLILMLGLYAPWPALTPLADRPSDWLRAPVTRITPPDQLLRQMDTGQPATQVRRSRIDLLLASLRTSTSIK